MFMEISLSDKKTNGHSFFYIDISTWTSDVTDMKELFKGKKDFNDDDSVWKVDQVMTMSYMFYEVKRPCSNSR